MRSHKNNLIFVVLLTVLPLSAAFAEQSPLSEQPISTSATQDSTYKASITVSPLHLINPVVELTAEYKVMPKLGIALLAAFGSQTFKVDQKDYSFPLWEIGFQGRFYTLGDFNHGMQVGLEALVLKLSDKTYDDGPFLIYAPGSRVEAGAFLGYKIATDIGFTVEAQAGAKYALILDGTMKTMNAKAADAAIDPITPLINVNIGWSF